MALNSTRIEELKQMVIGQKKWNDHTRQSDWRKSLFILRTIKDLPIQVEKNVNANSNSAQESATAIKCLEEVESGRVQMITFGIFAIFTLVAAAAILLIPCASAAIAPLLAICGAGGNAIPFIPGILLGATTAFYAKRYFERQGLVDALNIDMDKLRKDADS
ncbi:MAG: hypothetical protein LBI69_02905 [Puniceicoccales bacterium]|nr:hypothetical protein [Puniceicoccales bacterium]